MNKSKKRKPHFILKIFTVIFAVYAIFNIVSLRSSIDEKQAVLDDIDQQIYEQQVENQKLEESMGSELTEDEIAEIAMDKLGYAYPGERVFKNITGK